MYSEEVSSNSGENYFERINNSQGYSSYVYGDQSNLNTSKMNEFPRYEENSNKLDDIIGTAFNRLENEGYDSDNQNWQDYRIEKENQSFQAHYSSPFQSTNKTKQKLNEFFTSKNQTESIVNSSGRNSLLKSKQRSRVPGKLTQSQESIGFKDQIKKSSDSDHYYNFKIKTSVLDSHFYSLNQQKHPQKTHYDAQNVNKSPIKQTSNRSGFIKQNRLNNPSKSISKPKSLFKSQTSIQSSKNQQHISEHCQHHISEHDKFEVHFSQQSKNNYSKSKNPYQNIVTTNDFYQKLDQHKSTAESLKQTFDSEKINYKTNYSELDPLKFHADEYAYSEINPHLKQYENDLFQFIKIELITSTTKTQQSSEKLSIASSEYQKEKSKNSSLYQSYKKSQLQIQNLISNYNQDIFQTKNRIALLEQQILFYKQHTIEIQQSIMTKVKKQEDFYFKHKANLQETILQNNRKISQLQNQLFKTQNFKQKKQNSQNQKIDEEKNLDFVKNQNLRLQAELKHEQMLYETTGKKVAYNHDKFHELQRKKAEQIKGLVKEFEEVKSMVNFWK